MAYLNFGDIRTFTRIVDSKGTKASIVGVVVCVDTTNHNYVIVDTNGDEWTIGIGRSEVSSANIDQATQNVFNMFYIEFVNLISEYKGFSFGEVF